MSYIANQYNYATPLHSATSLSDTTFIPSDKKYFMLHDNTLDGSYVPISGSVGLWGTSVSDENGALPEPFIITVTDSQVIKALYIAGSLNNYPVDFFVTFYNGEEIVSTFEMADNAVSSLQVIFEFPITATHYTLEVSRISAPNAVARVYTFCPLDIIRRRDLLGLASLEEAVASEAIAVMSRDNIQLEIREAVSHIQNIIDRTHDKLSFTHDAKSYPTNVHTAMKRSSRRVFGKVLITYTDPMLDNETNIESSGSAHGSSVEQLLDTKYSFEDKRFMLYNNDLSGKYLLSDNNTQLGWISSVVSGKGGFFDEQPYVQINFSARPIMYLPVHFGTTNGSIIEDFTVHFIKADGSSEGYAFTHNKEEEVIITSTPISNVVAIRITVERVTKEGYPAVITEIPLTSTVEYVGDGDAAKLMNMDLLEELTYLDEIEALGGMSANEITVVISNEDKAFYFNNIESPVSQHLKRNRKIEPWLGVELEPGLIEWHTLGTFWSHNWNVPVGKLTATVVGFDTIGLLGTTLFDKHHVQIDKSIGELIEYVLNDAKRTLSFIEYSIDNELYEVIIPYAWFAASNHAAALRKISECYPMHIYCDRYGKICAKPQKLKVEHYVDTWSDSTNVVDKSYESLYTTLPNIINVKATPKQLIEQESLAKEELAFDVKDFPTRALNFSKPYVSDLALNIVCDETVEYTYNVYSWGIEIYFTGTGQVTSIECVGTALEDMTASVMTYKDDESIRTNGAVTRDVSSDFIQTSLLASTIISRLSSLSENDKYDATVNYRGDISLSINDPIRLLDGIAPDNRYNIKRHQLFWNGGLTGSAELNT